LAWLWLNDPELQTTPVVMVTTSGTDEDVQTSYRNGANSYIAKPVDLKISAKQSKCSGWSATDSLIKAAIMKILLVEDNPDQRDLISLTLEDFDHTWQVQAVHNGADALAQLETGVDYSLIMLDYSLPGEDGENILNQITQHQQAPPVIMVTGSGDEETAVAVMKAGAYEYVVKCNEYLTRLPVVVKRAVEEHQLQTEHQQAIDNLRKSEERYRTLVENAPSGILSIDLDGNIQEVNPKLLDILGSPSVEETKKINLFAFPPLVEAGVSETFTTCIKSGQALDAAHPYTSKWGKLVHLRYHLTPIHNANNQIIGVQANVIDISKRVEAQQELERLNDELEERVLDRTRDLETLVGAMAGREVRMADLKRVIKRLRQQLQESGIDPIADDPLNLPIGNKPTDN
jgi:PAS domain S-box-containing protein